MKKHAALNRIYRLVWSHARQALVAVAETAKGRGKQGTRRKLLLALALTPPLALGAPSGGEVIAGSGRITQQGSTTRIQQDSAKLSLNWQGFNVGSQESVVFAQPDASSVAVNRIYDANGSQILGHLSANGQVYLINPNGVLFGRGATVDVGGLVASTLDLQGTDAKGTHFAGNGQGRVVNDGTITAATGGYVALLGNKVTNTGTVTAQLGTVAMGAGSAVTLKFDGSTLAQLQVDQSVLKTTVENGGLVQANGGQVLMSAGAADSLLASVVNNTGVVEAQTVQQQGGKIVLLSGMSAGTTTVAGKLDASAPTGGNGGFIETSGAHVKVADDARITTAAPLGVAGTWLIDPHDFTVSATANGTVDNTGTPSGDISGATLSTALNTGNVTILSSQGSNASGSGDINVNDVVSWSANTLTLTAARDINVNAVMTASGSSTLELNTATANGADSAVTSGRVKMGLTGDGFTGRVDFGSRSGTGFLSINGQGYTVINALGSEGSTTGLDLQGMNGNLGGYYALGSNINASSTLGWSAGAGFLPVGSFAVKFTGSFEGLGHTIAGLSINRPTADYVGLFGDASLDASIRGLGLVGGGVTGRYEVGVLAGVIRGTLANSYATGAVSGNSDIGVLVGFNHGTITTAHATGSASGTGNTVGGLAGVNSGTLTNSYATGVVSGSNYIGGLVGINYFGTVTTSYATGAVNGSGNNVGGLAGGNTATATISASYAIGTVSSAGDYVGGLVGKNDGAVTDTYATGVVSGGNDAGGLVGYNAGTLMSSHAAGPVSGGNYVGGLVGLNYGTLTNTYATGAVSGTDGVGGLAGRNHGTLLNTYASGAVGGTYYVGGLVGRNYGTVTNGYATGDVGTSGTVYAVGGLVGRNHSQGTLTNAYAVGAVRGNRATGGLVGANYGTLLDTYATGAVSSGYFFGGLVGYNNLVGGAFIDSSYWNIDTSGQSGSAAGTGLRTGQMLNANNFTGFSFTTTPGGSGWVIVATDGTLNGSNGGAFPMLAFEYSTTITNAHQLQLMAMDLGASYTLGNNVDASATGMTGDVWSTAGFAPIGSQSHPFTGTFNGLGHTISGLTISRSTSDFVGLVSYANSNASLRNLGLVGGGVTGAGYVGALVGKNYASVANIYATGTVDGFAYVGGLVGWATVDSNISDGYATGAVSGVNSYVGGIVGVNYGNVANSFATGNVVGRDYLGGLIGYNSHSGRISSSHATGLVSGMNHVGGLLGGNGGTLSTVYATGTVTGYDHVGGLLGSNVYGSIVGSYAAGAVIGTYTVGGLVGYNVDSPLADSYAVGAVSGISTVGGLVGYNNGHDNNSAITNTYAMGAVGGSSDVGGLVGANVLASTITNSYWNTETTGQLTSSAGGAGLTTAQIMSLSSFASWNTASPNTISASGSSGATWRIYEGHTAPLLTSFLTPLTISSITSPYDGSTQTLPGSAPVGVLGSAPSGRNAGIYNGYYSTQQGYDISGGTLTITQRELTGAAIADGTSVYGDALALGALSWANLVEGDVVTAAVTLVSPTLSSSSHLKAGSYQQTASSTLTGTDAANYSFGGFTTSSANYMVSKLALTGAAIADADSVYGITPVPGALSWTNLVDGDAVSAPVSLVSPVLSTSSHVKAGSYQQTASATLTGADKDNYSFAGYTTPDAHYTVSRLALTGSIAAGSSVYGSALAPGAASFINAITNDDLGTVTVAVNTAGRTSTSGHLRAGSYSGVESVSALSGADASNYTFADLRGDYAVSALTLSGTAIAAGGSVYGDAVSPGAVSWGNLVDGDAVSASASLISPTLSSSSHVNAGAYQQTASSTLTGADAANYSFGGFTTSTANYMVSTLALSGAAIADGTSVYGAALAPGAVSWANVLGGDAVSAPVSLVSPVLSTSSHVKAGSYHQTASATLTGADKDNYSFAGYTTPGAHYTVSRLALTGSIAAGSSVYGSALAPGAASFTNAITNDDLGTVTVAVNTAGRTSTSGHLKADTYSGIEFIDSLSGADASNYTFAGVTGDYAVSTLALTGSIAAGSSVYGSALAPGAVSFTNSITNDLLGTATVLVNTAGRTSTSGHLRAGSYSGVESVSALSGADASNYTFAGVTGDYAVSTLALTGSIAAGSSVYGSALALGAVSFINAISDDALGTAMVAVHTSGRTSTSGHLMAGSYSGVESVSALSGADASNYTFADLRGDYAVSALTLSGTAIAAGGSVYGDAVSPGAVSWTNLIDGDAVTATASLVSPTLSSSSHENAGAYQQTASSTLTGADAANYSFGGFTTSTANYMVSTLALSGAAIADGTSVYGASVAPGAVSWTNLVDGDAVSAPVSLVSPTLSTSSHVKAGAYQQTASSTLTGADATNYSFGGFTTSTANYTVSKLALTGAAIADGTSVYADILIPGALSWDNLVQGDAVRAETSLVSALTSTSGKVKAGGYFQTASAVLTGSDAANYSFGGFSTSAANYEVSRRALSGAAIASGDSIYGAALAPGAVSWTNLIDGDAVTATASLVSPTLSSSSHENAGAYQQTASSTLTGADAANYSFGGFTTSTANYTVSKLALTGAAIGDGSSVYGATPAPGALSWTNLIDGDAVSAAVSLVSPTLSSSSHVKAGAYQQTASSTLTGSDAANYSFGGFTTSTANYTVSKLALIGAAIADADSVYGITPVSGALTWTNLLDGDAVSAVVSLLSPTLSSSSHVNAGSYQQTAASTLTGADAANYSFAGFTTPSANYTVSPLALAGSIAAGSSIYGSALVPGALTLTNVLAGDSFRAVVSIATAGNTSTSGHLEAGNYIGIESIGELSGTDAANYSPDVVVGGYTVSPLVLTASGIASAQSVYGVMPAVGAVSWSNLVNGDQLSSVVSLVSPTFSSSGNLRAGSYQQAASSILSGADAANYSFAGYTTPSANYTVSKLALTGSIAKGTSIYGNTLVPGAATFTNAIVGDVLGTATRAVATAGRTSRGGKLKAGNYTGIESVSALSGADAANYSFANVKGNYTVTKRALAGSISTGTSNFKATLKPGTPRFTNKITNDVFGKIVVGVNTTGKLKSGFLPVGSYTGIEFIKSLSGVDAANYTFANVKGSYKVTQ